MFGRIQTQGFFQSSMILIILRFQFIFTLFFSFVCLDPEGLKISIKNWCFRGTGSKFFGQWIKVFILEFCVYIIFLTVYMGVNNYGQNNNTLKWFQLSLILTFGHLQTPKESIIIIIKRILLFINIGEWYQSILFASWSHHLMWIAIFQMHTVSLFQAMRLTCYMPGYKAWSSSVLYLLCW